MRQPRDFFERKRKKISPHELGDEHEERVARRTGGKRQKGSGANALHKGDVKSGRFLMEAKTSAGKGVRISQHYVEKIWNEAAQVQKIPALVVGFPNVGIPVDRDWVMIPMKEFERLTYEEER